MKVFPACLRLGAGILFFLAGGCATVPEVSSPPIGQAADLDITPVLPPVQLAKAEAMGWLSTGLTHDMRVEPEKAAAAYRTAIGLDPDNRELRRFVFLQLLKTRQYNDALGLINEAQILWPDDAQAWLWEAQARTLLRQPSRAASALRVAIAKNPGVVGPHLDLARLLFQDRKFDEAESVLLQAIHRCPDSPLPVRFLADVMPFLEAAAADDQARANVQASALLTLDQALVRFPDDTALLAQSARLLMALGRFEDALARYKRVEQTKPDDLEAKVQLAGFLLRAAGGREEALGLLRAHNTRVPGDALALMYEGLLTETSKDPAPARAIYEKALDGQPVQVTTFQKLAALLIETNELAAAQAVLTRGLERFPEHPKLREWRAFLLMGEDKHAEAHALFKALEPARRREVQAIADPAQREREEKRLASFYLQYALAAQSVGDLENAPRFLREGVRHQPEQLALFSRHVGRIDEKGERVPDALRTLEGLGRLMPDEPFVFLQLGVMCNAAKRYEDAVGHFRRARRLAENRGTGDKLLTAFFHFHFGSALERTGRLAESEAAFRACMRQAPDFVEARNYLAYMWAERGMNLAEGLELIESALKEEPDNAAYRDTRGWIHFQAFRYPEAKADLEAALASEKMADDPELLRHLGDILWMMGEWDKAREVWRKIPKPEGSEDALGARLDWPNPEP